MSIELKTLGKEYLDKMIDFNHLCFPLDYWKDEDWKELIEDDRSVYYALMDGETVAACVFIYNWQGEKDYMKIMNIAVHPSYRQQGFASRLLEIVLEESKKSGLSRICGETRESNVAMQKTFEKAGYVFNKVEENCYHNPDESGWKYVLYL